MGDVLSCTCHGMGERWVGVVELAAALRSGWMGGCGRDASRRPSYAARTSFHVAAAGVAPIDTRPGRGYDPRQVQQRQADPDHAYPWLAACKIRKGPSAEAFCGGLSPCTRNVACKGMQSSRWRRLCNTCACACTCTCCMHVCCIASSDHLRCAPSRWPKNGLTLSPAR